MTREIRSQEHLSRDRRDPAPRRAVREWCASRQNAGEGRRLGRAVPARYGDLAFSRRQIEVPDDFDRMGGAAIEQLSAGSRENCARHTSVALGGLANPIACPASRSGLLDDPPRIRIVSVRQACGDRDKHGLGATTVKEDCAACFAAGLLDNGPPTNWRSPVSMPSSRMVAAASQGSVRPDSSHRRWSKGAPAHCRSDSGARSWRHSTRIDLLRASCRL